MPNSNNKSSQNTGMPMGGPGGMSMSGSSEKAKDFSSSIKKLISYCKKYIPLIVFSIILSILGSVLNVIGPDYLSEITDLITEGIMTEIDIEAVVDVALFLAILYGLGFVCNIIQGILMSDMAQKVSKQLRSDLDKKMNRLPLKYFDNNILGDILSRITNDIDTLGQSLTQSLSSSITSIATLVGAIVMMFYTNVILTIASILATLIGFILMLVIISRSQKYFNQQQTELGKINGHIEEIYTGHSIVKTFNGVRNAKKEFDMMNQELYDSAWKSQFMSGLMQPLMSFIGNFGYVVVCIVGAILVLQESITFGVVVAFMAYIRLFTQPLTQIAQVATSLQSAAAASERVFEFLEEEEMNNDHDNMEVMDIKGNVIFDHVQFGYHSNQTIINDFSLVVKPGQKIAIVGPTGAGKTTIVNLLMRFYEINKGQILIDNVPIQNMQRNKVRSMFGMVLQDTWIFNGTMRENIIYNKAGVTERQLDDVCKAVGLYHYIQTLPNGYDTVLDDNANISAGQRQLITIARAMIENAPMLILDEATSSVDTRTEIIIQNAMDKLMKGRTSFVIAHRLSTIRNADIILVMKEGDIIEKGSHDDLILKNGFYAELYNSQFE